MIQLFELFAFDPGCQARGPDLPAYIYRNLIDQRQGVPFT
jgi:hypothetical protein